MNWIFDIAIIAVFIIAVSVNARRGFVKSVLLVSGYVLSVGLAAVIGAAFGENIYHDYAQEKITDKIQSYVDDIDSAKLINEKLFLQQLEIEASDEEVREAILKDGKLSQNLSGLAAEKKSGIKSETIESFLNSDFLSGGNVLTLSDKQSDAENAVRILAIENKEERSQKLHDELVEPLGIKVTEMIISVGAFVIISLLVSFAVKKANFVNRIPIAGTLNTVLGGMIGAVEAIVIIVLAIVILKLGTGLGFFEISQNTIDNTVVFKVIYDLVKW